MIPLLSLKKQYDSIKGEIQDAIQEVLESQEFILGPKVKQFEEEMGNYCNVPFAIGVASGSDALLLSMMALEIGPGDEVITTPYTFFSTAGTISRPGAKPVFVDIDPKTFNLEPQLITERITNRTKAIIPVHLFGQCANMEIILKVAQNNQLWVIEDGAQAIGATHKKRMAGSMGDLGCLSFFPSKNLGGYGDGGMILTKNPKLAQKIRTLRVHGAEPKYYHERVGCNSRLDAIQAAVLSVKLRYLDKWTMTRRRNAEIYNRILGASAIQIPYCEPDNEHVYNQYVIRSSGRDALQKYLFEQNISTEVYYPLPLHLQKCYIHLGHQKGDFPEAEKASQETLSLPVFPELMAEDLRGVGQLICNFLRIPFLIPAGSSA